MQIFNLIDLSKMGEPHEEYGQAYWAEDDNGRKVKFNKKDADLIAPLTISAEEATPKTSAKGTEYLSLRKVSVAEKAPDSVSETPKQLETTSTGQDFRVSSSTAQLDRIESQLQEIDSKLDKLLGGTYEP